jgi:hypothetical protein
LSFVPHIAQLKLIEYLTADFIAALVTPNKRTHKRPALSRLLTAAMQQVLRLVAVTMCDCVIFIRHDCPPVSQVAYMTTFRILTVIDHVPILLRLRRFGFARFRLVV